MTTSYAGLYRRVKDGRTPVGDRLKLVRYAWCCQRVYLPNKQQVLIDTVCGLLLNKNRKNLSDEDVLLVWGCLLQLLTSAASQAKCDQNLLVKPSLCQILIDSLQSCISKGHNSAYLSHVISCCRVVISSSALSYVFMTKFDNLISLLSVLCQLCTKLNLGSERPALFVLLDHVTTACIKCLNLQANQKQVLQLVVEKLLVPVMMLLHVAMETPEDNDLCAVSLRLTTVLELALFHKDHESSFDIYLIVLFGADDSKFQPPKMIENIFQVFSQLIAGKVPLRCPTMSSEMCQNVVCSYLPSFFKAFVQHNKKNSSLCFKMFKLICDLIGLKSVDDVPSEVLPVSQVVRVANSCLQEVLKADLYNVALDNASGRNLFAFFKHLVGQMLKFPRDGCWYECLSTMLELNHGILETQMTRVLTSAWIETVKHDSTWTASMDDFLSDLVSTYSRLHQIPRWFDFVLSAIKDNTSTHQLLCMPAAFYKRLGDVIEALPQTSVLDVWQKLADEIKSCVKLVCEHKEIDKCWNMLHVCQIYDHFVSHVKVADYSITELNAAKIFDLMVSMETDVLVPLFGMCTGDGENAAVLIATLMLCTAHGELKLLLALYCRKHRARIETVASVSHLSDLTLVHSYLTVKEWGNVFRKVQHSNKKIVLYLLDQLLLQKVRACLVFCEDQDVCKTSVDNVLEMLLSWIPETSSAQCSESWNLRIENVTDGNYHVAKWKLIADNASVFLPVMSSKHVTHLGQFLLSTFQHHQQSCSTERQELITMSSVTRKLLEDPVVMETRLLVSSMITSLWTTLRKSLSPNNSPRKKRKHTATWTAILDGLEKLENSEVLWHLPVDSVLVDHLQLVAERVNQVLQVDDMGQETSKTGLNTDIIQILHQLPLYYLTPGNQLQCVFGLVFLTTLLFSQSELINNDQSQHLIQLTSVELLSVLLESSVGSCPVFQLLHPGKFFQWLQKLLSFSDSERLAATMRRLMGVTARSVTGDVDVLLGIGGFISTLSEELMAASRHLDAATITPATSMDRSRFTVAACLLHSIVKQLKKSNQTSSVRSACQKYFTQLSLVFTTVLSKMRVRQEKTTLLTPSHPIIYGFSSVLSHSRDVNTVDEEMIGAVQFVLDFAVNLVESAKFEDYEMDVVCLKFIKTICLCRTSNPDVCGEKTFSRVWAALIKMITMLSRTNTQKITMSSKSKDVTNLDKCHSGNMTIAAMMSLKGETTVDETKCDGNDADVADFKTHQWKTRLNVLHNTVTIAMLSCDLDEFKSLLMGLVNDMSPGNVSGNPETIVTAVNVWSNLLSGNLSEGQGHEVARVSQHVIMNYQEILRVVDGNVHEDVVLRVAVPVVTSQLQMINYGLILMSSHLAVNCLHSCLIMPLEGVSYETFVPAFRAVYGVLNSLMLNHTEHMLQSIPSLVVAVTRLMKGLVAFGAQSRLNTNMEHTDAIVQCTNMLTKLLELISGHSVEFGKVSVYLLADYTSEIQKTTLLPVVKRAFLPGIYSILNICDDHGIAHLRTSLPLGVRDVFHVLYTDYKKYFRFSGRI
ncbi:unhealthy ribosome biogenesis protein 2 homolog [Gigantopelta aegis]|uniref:unhealthy ribosome biogenesis protein 2 homolog n=1 Tax=Gigantopelta aegis TaxID=1735272 RepID=UPI001B88CDE4|nr:unhealthy ribosome biogenesis protein 2 homolog [Gigantopelta aegis]